MLAASFLLTRPSSGQYL